VGKPLEHAEVSLSYDPAFSSIKCFGIELGLDDHALMLAFLSGKRRLRASSPQGELA